MAEVTVTDSTLTVEIAGFDKLWSLQSRLDILLAHVRSAAPDPDVADAVNRAVSQRDAG